MIKHFNWDKSLVIYDFFLIFSLKKKKDSTNTYCKALLLFF